MAASFELLMPVFFLDIRAIRGRSSSPRSRHMRVSPFMLPFVTLIVDRSPPQFPGHPPSTIHISRALQNHPGLTLQGRAVDGEGGGRQDDADGAQEQDQGADAV